MPVRYFQQAFI